ncbi:hypothetical protein DASC09_028560 [Saccharomycopsis crataegensis]|uniref:Uncharacterized protein n=1 Tax=Saccharomycopsis crataegensis TaxID=43959 RepID=A0AAV5QLF9_9ASCO|nr:hypothetical protein DASC09_028560 [Saccharomycopsis crataegensis]
MFFSSFAHKSAKSTSGKAKCSLPIGIRISSHWKREQPESTYEHYQKILHHHYPFEIFADFRTWVVKTYQYYYQEEYRKEHCEQELKSLFQRKIDIEQSNSQWEIKECDESIGVFEEFSKLNLNKDNMPSSSSSTIDDDSSVTVELDQNEFRECQREKIIENSYNIDFSAFQKEGHKFNPNVFHVDYKVIEARRRLDRDYFADDLTFFPFQY